MRTIMLAFGLAAGSTAAAASQFAAWLGEWRLDRAASHFRGDVTRIASTSAGYRFDLGAVSFTLPDDGAFHPTIAGRETRLVRLGGGRWTRDHRINGRVVDHSVLTLSDDDRTLTIAGEHPGAAPERLVREGGGIGLAGTWRSTRLGINVADTLSITAAGAARLRWGSPADGNWYVVTVGGPPAINQGPTSTAIATLQLSASRNGTLRWTERVDGKPSRIGIDQRSDDGGTMTETEWPAGSPSERQTLVYRHAGRRTIAFATTHARITEDRRTPT